MTEQNTASRTLAVFDFDDTLNKGDSFRPFMWTLAGGPQTLWNLCQTLYACFQQKPKDARTFIKAEMMRRLLQGKTIADIKPAITIIKEWMRELPTAETLRAHYAKGHHVVIATGSLSVYMPFLLDNLPHHALICTDIEMIDGKITGEMINGNCVRERKAELVASYIAEHGPFEESWGYGNLPHDLPMLMLVKNRVVV